ncbi:MAG: hypothetical protein FJZ15_01935 [Candidatus Omnitrophica bacterium]|nr:hypothetical protein [Candidatus Omnitrophota bacterium]
MSLKKRYLYKLISNLTGFVMGIVTQAIVPRSLGPASYGNFSFITSFFSQVLGFLNLNSSTAFFTKLSQNQKDIKIVSFYFRYLAFIGVILGGIILVSMLGSFDKALWPNLEPRYVIMGAVWAFLTFLAMILGDMSDAYGLTVNSETIKVSVKFLSVILLLLMFWKQLFTLFNYFVFQLSILLLTALLLIYLIRKSGFRILSQWAISKEESRDYRRQFSRFCFPLVIFLVFACLEQILDRWFLQKFSGSVKQGFYALSYQIGGVCFLFTSAVIPLVFREQAIHFSKKNFSQMRDYFKRSAFMLYVLTAFFCCFLAVESKSVLRMFGGRDYAGAFLPLLLMCFFPIHQTYGQLNANFFFATDRVKVYRDIGLIIISIGIPMTFILLGPKDFGALQAGATGLAIKMVFLQILSVNIQLWNNSKFLNLKFASFLRHQIVVITVFILAALLGSLLMSTLFPAMNFILRFLLSGMFYSAVSFLLIIFKPDFFNLDKKEIVAFTEYVKLKISGK